jgi:hypothetical protein
MVPMQDVLSGSRKVIMESMHPTFFSCLIGAETYYCPFTPTIQDYGHSKVRRFYIGYFDIKENPVITTLEWSRNVCVGGGALALAELLGIYREVNAAHYHHLGQATSSTSSMVDLSGGITEAGKKVNTAGQDRFQDRREWFTTATHLFNDLLYPCWVNVCTRCHC